MQRKKHRLLEAALIDLGHSLMNVAFGQETTEDILAQNMILTFESNIVFFCHTGDSIQMLHEATTLVCVAVQQKEA